MGRKWGNFSSLIKESITTLNENQKNKEYMKDERFWREDTKNIKEKVIYKVRPLPIVIDDRVKAPYLQVQHHNFYNPITGKFSRVECPRTIDNPCPVCDIAWALYGTGDPTDKELFRAIGPKQVVVFNILVRKEATENRKSNEGKVFMYKANITIWNKFKTALNFDGKTPEEDILNPFDILNGYDMNIVVAEKAGFANFEGTSFSRTSSPIAATDEEIETILNSAYDIEKELKNESRFKSPNELLEILYSIHPELRGIKFENTGRKKSMKVEEVATNREVSFKVEPVSSSNETSAIKTENKEKKSTSSVDDDFLAELEQELMK